MSKNSRRAASDAKRDMKAEGLTTSTVCQHGRTTERTIVMSGHNTVRTTCSDCSKVVSEVPEPPPPLRG
ncbi:hypothetical protein JOF56_011595 [Kibdelosporangium banguiense]|uniref:Uncharacterized protein n=1 Tax=Kibdelosporangium banguiense TaxID=1365924 RepID=A0ABS4U3L2_9PSEU|nr:hypothetical protein [Kibdelosporangium banguiense]